MARRRLKIGSETFRNDYPGLFDVAESDGDETPELQPLEEGVFAVEDKLRFMSFGSGSSGNCSYIGTAKCGLLIDAGVDNNYVTERLAANSIDINTIHGILLTHDHGDHVRYAYALLRRNRHMKLFATPKALSGLLRRHSMSRRIKDYHSPIYKEFPVKIGDLTVTAFETSHDGTDNAGFYIEGAGTTFVVATDTGTITSRADYYIRRTRHLMIESNYDAEMLRTGRYPQYLKARIFSTSGHLDNADTARYLASIASGVSLGHVFLCHLSQDNNTPQIALSTIRTELEGAGIKVGTGFGPVEGDKIMLGVLPRSECSPLVALLK